ncbi:MAG: nitrous oxide reductase accessory protein NosL [Bacteroidetes bacterium]|nr:nitrous oxide reductase accessory protein NosL [Bacteroidota bacterium]
MHPISRIILIVVSLSMIGAFFLPLWDIFLDAPQYPEGLQMQIWLDHLSGDTKTINGLNHYIGMKLIYEENFPEFKWMPTAIGVLIGLGLITALLKRKLFLLIFYILFLGVGVVGVYDFYNWEYDYGHNLNPHAAIKIPGMNYQPPLFGTKQLLNFTATSLPAEGGKIVMIAGTIVFLLVAFEYLFRKKKKPALVMASIFFLASFSLTSCSTKPEAIQYGEEACSFCKMGISDVKFGAEIITTKGKIYKFDALECMLNYTKLSGDEVKAKYVIDASAQGKLIEAKNAFYMYSQEMKSPMGTNISAFENKAKLIEAIAKYGGKELSWQDLPERIGKK